jgi:small-conductance mechanosensitive channel
MIISGILPLGFLVAQRQSQWMRQMASRCLIPITFHLLVGYMCEFIMGGAFFISLAIITNFVFALFRTITYYKTLKTISQPGSSWMRLIQPQQHQHQRDNNNVKDPDIQAAQIVMWLFWIGLLYWGLHLILSLTTSMKHIIIWPSSLESTPLPSVEIPDL